MTTNWNLIAPCGLYCGVCAIYITHRYNNQKMKKRLVDLYKGNPPDSERLSVEDIRCGGCLSDELFMDCRKCEIKICSREKGHSGCQCDDFPCRTIENFSMTVCKKIFIAGYPVQARFGTKK